MKYFTLLYDNKDFYEIGPFTAFACHLNKHDVHLRFTQFKQVHTKVNGTIVTSTKQMNTFNIE